MIVIATTYSGNLVAVLTFPKIVQPIQTVQDLMSVSINFYQLNLYKCLLVLNSLIVQDWWISWATQRDSDISEVLKFDKWYCFSFDRIVVIV